MTVAQERRGGPLVARLRGRGREAAGSYAGEEKLGQAEKERGEKKNFFSNFFLFQNHIQI